MWKKFTDQISKVPPLNGLWRSSNFFLSVVCFCVSVTLGPILSLAYYLAGRDGELISLCRRVPNYCTFLTYIHLLMWLLFFASVLWVSASLFKSIRILNYAKVLIILEIMLSGLLFTIYLIHCSLYDRMCLSKKHDDVNIISYVFMGNILYMLFLCALVLLMNEYKMRLLQVYFGFVSFIF